ncbi:MULTISPECIES: (2Fe-2S)-binding protein [unclassified Streptomyces]|uniref:(2Fe-2S)-binding protein n=1 Tax=unclassified Streptomyces TaxID=2593676 RepID=UPI002E3470B8|nr:MULTISPECIES: (2Fe-2S)-binding protein [unclassified Streptomyces]
MPLQTPAVTAAYRRLAEVHPTLEITEVGPHEPLPRGAGWTRADELAAGGPALDAYLAWDTAQVLRDHGRPARPDVVAGFGFHRYAWQACLLITVPWFSHRRVPRLAGVAFHRSPDRLAVRLDGFACLPDDPAAALPGARVVPDEDALRREVRDAVAEHLGPVLEGFGPRMRRGRRALWAMVTDEVVEGLWHVGGLLGEEERARTELEALLPASAAPYPTGTGFRTLTAPDGSPLPTRDRAGCCLFYTIRPEDTCLTCPRTCDADRVTRLAAAADGALVP